MLLTKKSIGKNTQKTKTKRQIKILGNYLLE